MARERTVNLRITAKDEYSAQLKAARESLRRLQAVQDDPNQGHLAKMRTISQEAARLTREYQGARTQVAALGKAMAGADTPTAQMTREFKRAQTALAGMKREMQSAQAQAQKFRNFGSRAGGFAAFARRTNPLAEAGAGAGAAAAGGWWARLTGGIVGSAATAHGRGPLGLRPYELQNLSFQINDVVTGLISGQRPMQVFAQQGGQIAQLFPRATLAILRFTPALLGIVAAVAPVVGALSRLRESGDILEQFSTQLVATADAAAYDPAVLLDLVRNLQRVGVAADDSRAAISSMIGEGVSTGDMERFILIARDAAAVWGTEFPDALRNVREGFDGTFESLDELDQKFNFLTAAQRETIREQYELGRGFSAADDALDIFAERMGDAAELQRGEWSQAAQDFANAWRNLLDWIGSTAPIEAARLAFEALGRGIAATASALNMIDDLAADVSARVQSIGIQTPRSLITGDGLGPPPTVDSPPPVGPVFGPPAPTEQQTKDAARAREEAEAEAREATLKAMDETGRMVERANEELARNRERQAEREARALDSVDQSIADTIFEDTLTSVDERTQRQMRAVREAEQELSAVGLALDADRRAAIQETTGALYDQEQAAKAAKDALKEKSGGGSAAKGTTDQARAEEHLNALLEQRSLLIEQIEYQEENDNPAAAEALRDRVESVNDQIRAAVGNMRAFWTAAGGGVEAQNALLKLENIENELAIIGQQSVTSGREINEMIADGAVDAMDEFGKSIAESGLSVKAFGDAFLAMAADFLREIAQMIARQAILNALQGGGGAAGGVGGVVAGAVNGLFRHDGGLADGAGRYKRLPAAMFAAAPRYHGGGIAGLAPGEMPAILQRNEEVLTRDDPRHTLNGGGRQGGGGSVKVVNVFDPADVLQQALQTERGQKVFTNWATANARRLNTALSQG